MNKIILTTTLTACLALGSLAQEVKFFVNKSSSTSAACECKTTTSIKVTFPVPSNVTSFDEYQFYISLSSLDVPAIIGFEKAEIAAKLSGKKEFTAYLLKEDGSSDFYFEDVFLDKSDLCNVPRMWNIETLEIQGGGVGYKILGYHYESTWNEYYNRWEESKFADWDEGTEYGEGSLNMKEAPLSDGFMDQFNIITVKAESTDSASFSISEDVEHNGSLMIEDKSEEFDTRLYYATWAGGDATYQQVKEEVINSLGGKFQVGAIHNFYELEGMQQGKEVKLSGSHTEFTPTTFNGVTYETISHYRTGPGFYATFYLSRSGEYTILIVSHTAEKFSGDPGSPYSSFEMISALTAEDIEKIKAIDSKWLNATTYSFPQ